jgi:hypothetical protein
LSATHEKICLPGSWRKRQGQIVLLFSFFPLQRPNPYTIIFVTYISLLYFYTPLLGMGKLFAYRSLTELN